MTASDTLRGETLVGAASAAAAAAAAFVREAKSAVSEAVMRGVRIDNDEFDRKQRAAHGLAWMATLSECLKATAKWADERHGAGQLNRLNECAVIVGFSEYLGQLIGGLPMGQNEIVRPSEFGLSLAAADLAGNPAVARFVSMDGSCCRSELTQIGRAHV